MIKTIDVRVGKYMFPVEVLETHERIFFKFGFNKGIMDEVKSMTGVQYHGFPEAQYRDVILPVFGTDKIWSCLDCVRNRFQLQYLQGGNPYKRWDDYFKNPIKLTFKRKLRAHQKELVTHALMVHFGIWAAEMGTGKTLAAIEVMERSGFQDWWYVAPKSALKAVELEFLNWGMEFRPKLMTYNQLVKEMKNWPEGQKAPQGVFFDESQKIKTPSSQRSEAALGLANGIRADWGDEGYVILMSGSPAPKAPTDWWHQCEVAYPGFIREGTLNKFQLRLGVHEQKEGFSGGVYNERLAWLDDERKCGRCGKYDDDVCHSAAHPDHFEHDWIKSENEVAKLYKRMKGLVIVKFKKDCLDLPEKQYRIIKAQILPSTVRAAQMIAKTTSSAAAALTLLRELSDGFQYVEVPDGEKDCEQCLGSCEVDDFKIKPEYAEEYDKTGIPPAEDCFDTVRVPCPSCGGSGKVARFKRTTQRVPCPKDDILRGVLDEHDDVGRLVVYAGFEGSVNRCVEVAQSEKWAVVKWDGKGIKIIDADGTQLRPSSKPITAIKSGNSMDAEGAVQPLIMFQKDFERFPRVCFVGNAGAAGTGLTLTASPSIFYYSNSFNAEDRIQSEDRIHRMGMDENRGATIIDCLHLPTDEYVLNNLKKKRDLQSITMGELNSIFHEESDGRVF